MIKAYLNFSNRSLIQNLVYNTTKSSRQTTPRLFRNPRLTPNGIVTKQPKSYDYDLPQDLENRHLYWDRSVMNKILRKSYNQRKLKKLQIEPIHDQTGVRTYDRQATVILRELSNLHLIRQSIGRTLQNLRQMLKRFPEESRQSQRDIIISALKQLHDRFLVSMPIYHFSTFCQICYLMSIPPSQQMLIHFYKHIEAAQYHKDNKIKFPVLCKLGKYLFSRKYPEKYKELLYVIPFEFKLFEDNPPRVRPLEDMLPRIYSEQYIQELRSGLQEENRKLMSNLERIPGGNKLRGKIQAATDKP